MMSTYEKIETIVLCRMQNPQSWGGTYGTIIEYAPRKYKVLADGRIFFVNTCEQGWKVRECGSSMVAIDPELLEAARMAIVH